MMIPFVLIPILQTLIAYFATAIGLVSKTVILVPWITPPIISGYLATAGDWRASVLQIFLLILGVIIYLPRLEEHTSELQSRFDIVCRLLLVKNNYTLL